MLCWAQRVTAGRSSFGVDGAREPRETASHLERVGSQRKKGVRSRDVGGLLSTHGQALPARRTVHDASTSPNAAVRNEAVSDIGVAQRCRAGVAPGRNEIELAVRLEADDGEGSAVKGR